MSYFFRQISLDTDLNLDSKYLAWLNDRELLKYSRNSSYTVDEALEYIRDLRGGGGELFIFGYLDGRDEIAVGTCSMRPLHDFSSCDLGFLIDKNYWGLGWGRWCLDKMMGVEDSLYRSYTIGCRIENSRMRRLAKASGFRLEGKRGGFVYYRLSAML